VTRPLAALACLLAALAGAAGARAQDPLSLVDRETQVRSLRFVETDGAALDEGQLELQVATRAPGFVERLRSRLLGGGGVYPLLPIEVARDAVRLQRYYVRNGFPRAETDYAVEFDSSANRASVTFTITHGPPLVIGDVTFGAGGRRTALDVLPPDVHAEWATFTQRIALRGGDRLDEFGLVDLQNQTLGWLRARGWAFADVGVERFVDETGLRADVRLKLTPGVRARYDAITVEGLDGLPERLVTRELPFESGDRFDARELTEGQREIFGLGLFQLALVDLAPEQPRDSTVDVSVRLRRGPTRVLTGFGGYFSDGGVTLRGQATHRNAFGGARQATLSLEARTGLFGAEGQSVTGGPVRDLLASLSVRQPYVFDRRVSLTVQPSLRDRSDEIEDSRVAELSSTLLYQRSALRTLSLTALGRYRDLSSGQSLRLLDPGGALDADSLTAVAGGLGLDGTWGTLDNPLTPRRGWVVRPGLSGSAGDLTFGRARASGTLLMPFGRRSGVVARASVGALVGRTDTPRDYLLARDRLFFAGGTGDVRGWGTARLGPKTLSIYPDADGRLSGPGDVVYVGIGGRAKASASLQVNLPLPLGPQWGANVFVDAGGVWQPDPVPTADLLRSTGNVTDASLADVLDREGGLRVGTGAGIQYLSPVGFVSLALGVKVNPSALDLRAPGAVLCGNDFEAGGTCTGGYVGARLAGVPFNIDTVEPETTFWGRLQTGRLQFHLSIGQTF